MVVVMTNPCICHLHHAGLQSLTVLPGSQEQQEGASTTRRPVMNSLLDLVSPVKASLRAQPRPGVGGDYCRVDEEIYMICWMV